MDTKALRQKVLDLAIRGKLVPQDPNDEPASVLLERIRQQKQQMVKEGKLKAKDIKNDSIIFVDEDNLHYEKFADGSVKCIEDDIPFDLPDGWAWARLGAVAEAIGDGDHQPPPQTSFGVPFLVISNVSGGQLKTRVLSAKNISANYPKLASHEMVICFLQLLAPMGFQSWWIQMIDSVSRDILQ